MMCATLSQSFLTTSALTAVPYRRADRLVSTAAATLMSVAASTLGAGPAAAACTATSAPNYTCSGTETTGQTINDDNAAVSTASGFSVDASAGAALTITGNGALSYTDLAGASLSTDGTTGLAVTTAGDGGATAGSITIETNGDISGANDGIEARQNGGGVLDITANGSVTGRDIFGIEAYASGSGLAITTGDDSAVMGAVDGIQTRNNGSGRSDIYIGSTVVGTEWDGLDAENYGTELDITTAAGSSLTGADDGMQAYNYGTGDTTITINGTVAGTADAGVYSSTTGGGQQTIAVGETGVVSGGRYGIWLDDPGTVTVGEGGKITGGRHGVWFDNPGSIVNSGTVSGTDGVAVDFDLGGVQVTTGAIAIAGEGVSIVNSGTIVGGVVEDGITVAIGLNGDDNRLELQDGFDITGLVVMTDSNASNNVFALGGDDDSSFAADALGQQYIGFNRFEKTGGSTWMLTGDGSGFMGDITVSEGTLDITGPLGSVVGTIDYTGADSSATATARVTGADASWTNSSELNVGFNGNGTLNIEDGGAVSDTFGYIGYNSGSTGSATVTGVGSTWTNSDSFFVGYSGTGTLTIEDGGLVSDTAGFIANVSGSTGTATVTGAGSTWANSVNLYVGNFGNGTLNVENGGAVSNTDAYIGLNPGSTGTVTVSGTDGAGNASTWTNSGDLSVGHGGTGTLNIGAGGTVSNTSGTIGEFAGSSGTVTVAGENATWQNSSSLIVGHENNGELAIGAGGTVTNSISGVIGYTTGSEGAVTVEGENASWENGGALTVGLGGTGELTIGAGGTVINGTGWIGNGVGSQGSVTVAGANASWENVGSALFVGYFGTGELSIGAGGTVSNSTGIIGGAAGSQGSVTVEGENAVWQNSADLFIGGSGTGELTIGEGATVSNTAGVIGNISGSSGTATVTGDGSTWTNSNSLVVGDYGDGTLSVADGGTVRVADGAGSVGIARFAGSISALNIGAAVGEAAIAAGTLDAAEVRFGAGGGSLNFNHTDADYAFASAISGAGTINQIAGTTSLTGDSSGFTGQTSISGGVLLIDGSLGDGASTVAVTGGGGLGGTGTIGGAVTVADGTLIGVQGQMLSMSTLTLGGDSTIDVTLGAPGDTGLFTVSGDLMLDGTLDVSDAGGFGSGVYRLIDYGGVLTDNGLGFGTLPTGITAAELEVQTAQANQVNLVVTDAGPGPAPDIQFWDGPNTTANNIIDGGSGTWSLGPTNWTRTNGDVNDAWGGDFAVFQGAAGTLTVDNGAGSITASGMQFANDGFRVEGDAIALGDPESIVRVGDGTTAGTAMTATIASALTGDTRLIKTDFGSLVLAGPNSYTGGTELRNGTLSVSSDGNLGAASGDITFAGGELASTASFDSARAVMLDADGIFNVAAATTLGLSGKIAGAGDLVKRGTGTLELSGANSYGNTLIEDGTLIGDLVAIRGDVANAGTVVFNQASDGSFAGDIAGLGGTDGAMVKRGAGTLTLAGGSTLDWTIDAGGLVSATNRFGGDVAVGADGSFTFDQDYAGTYAGTLSGAGDFLLTGGGAIALTGDSSGFAGTSALSDTTLVVNEALGGSLSILDGGRLEGTGTVGTTTVASGGTLAPGNSMGTLTVEGDLSFAAGSRYEVEVDPAGMDSDLIAVTGTATLNGGALAHIGVTGSYDPTSTYTILTADGGVSGTFDTVSSDFAFLDPSLGYGANAVTLTLQRNDIDFDDVGRTRNQRATAGGVESLGFGNALYEAVVQLDETTARSTFDQLSGEIHASLKSGLIEDSRHVRNAINDRIRAAFEGAGASSAPVLAYGPDGPAPAPASSGYGMAGWGQMFGSWGETDGDGNAAQLDRSTGGLIIGADGLLDDWRLGLLAGYSHSSFEADARASSASSDNYHLGAYAGTQWGALAFRSGLAYTWSDIDTARSVGFLGFSDSLSANYDAGTFQAFGELGHGIQIGTARFEPFVNLAHVSLRTDGFTEDGGAAVLTAGSQTTDTTFTTLGVRAETGFTLGGMTATARGMVGWRHAFGETTPLSTHAFAGGDAFSVAGVPIAEDAAVVELGFDLDLTDKATLGLSYGGQFGSGAQDHSARANFSLRF